MSAYIIDFSEPLRQGFSIPAGGFNGPGGSSSNTSLRLYGRGALEWGESVDEDLVRLTENFASASSPSSAISGQTWVERSLYYRNTALGNVLQGWYYYDLNETILSNKWKLVNGTGVISSTPALTPVEGQYYFWNGTDSPLRTEGAGLYGYYSLGRYEPAAWRRRSSFEGNGAPTASTVPPQYFRTFNELAGWSTPSPINLSSSTPSNPYIGMLWYNTTTGILQVYTANGWQNILGPTLNPSNPTVSVGNVNMGGYKITNLGNGTAATDAVNKGQLDAAIGGAGTGVFLPLTGGTLTGPLQVNSTLGVSGAVTFSSTTTHTGNATFSTLSSSGLASLNSVTTTGAASVGTTLTVSGTATFNNHVNMGTTLTVGGLLSMSNQRITDVAAPSLTSDAANKQYVDNSINSALIGALTPSQVSLVNPSGAPKNGDIRTLAPNIVEIYSNGAWRRVFPAQWAA